MYTVHTPGLGLHLCAVNMQQPTDLCTPTLPRFSTAGVPHSHWSGPFWVESERWCCTFMRFLPVSEGSYISVPASISVHTRPVHGAMNPRLTPPPRRCPFLTAVAHAEPSERTVLTQIINTQDHQRSHLWSASSWAVLSIVQWDIHVRVEGWALNDCCAVLGLSPIPVWDPSWMEMY